MTTAQESSADNTSPNAVSGVNSQFPNTLELYSKQTVQLGKTTTFYLGEDESHDLFVAGFHMSWTGNSDLTLHNGPDVNSPVLATAKNERLLGNFNSTVKVMSGSDNSVVSERLKMEFHATGQQSHVFIVMAGTGPNAAPEKFEWRPSRSEEVMGGKKAAWGWKLVRLDGDNSVHSQDSGERALASDGSEVVATMTHFSGLDRRVATFKFLGCGATGELGEIWSVMAVVTALRIWQLRWYLGSA